MTADTLQTVSLVIGLAGLLALMRPAFKADRFAKRESDIAAAVDHSDTDAFLKELRRARIGHAPPLWSPLDSACLRGGYVLLGGSYVIQLAT